MYLSQIATCEVASIVFGLCGFVEAGHRLHDWFDVVTESYMLSKTQGCRDFTRPMLQAFIS